MLYIQTFGALDQAHISKKVQKEKLESRAVNVQMLGWWTNETKEYRLEDLENKKLITSYNVQILKMKYLVSWQL